MENYMEALQWILTALVLLALFTRQSYHILVNNDRNASNLKCFLSLEELTHLTEDQADANTERIRTLEALAAAPKKGEDNQCSG